MHLSKVYIDAGLNNLSRVDAPLACYSSCFIEIYGLQGSRWPIRIGPEPPLALTKRPEQRRSEEHLTNQGGGHALQQDKEIMMSEWEKSQRLN